MKKVFSLMSRLYGEIKKNGISNTYYKVKEKKAKNMEYCFGNIPVMLFFPHSGVFCFAHGPNMGWGSNCT
jgi:hypothetical protein